MSRAWLAATALALTAHAGLAADSPARFRDNGDGTATDRESGLTWELKLPAAGTVHGVEGMYTWTVERTLPNGTVFTKFLATLNDRCDGDESKACAADLDCAGIGSGRCGFAGYRDWRLPEAFELRSLLAAAYPNCTRDPCVAAGLPGATGSAGYWTNESDAADPANAVAVIFINGIVGSGPKIGRVRARAVRGFAHCARAR